MSYTEKERLNFYTTHAQQIEKVVKEISKLTSQSPEDITSDVKEFLDNLRSRVNKSAVDTNKTSEQSLKNLLLSIPNVGEDNDFSRISDRGRDITL